MTGFELEFNTAMNPASAGDASNYKVDWVSVKRVKRKKVQVFHPVPISVDYNAATHSVNLLLSGKQAFTQGGQITVIANNASGVSSALGVLLDGNDEGIAGDNGVFTILSRAKGISR